MGCRRGVLVIVIAALSAGCVVVPTRSWVGTGRTTIGARRLTRITVQRKVAQLAVERDNATVTVYASVPRRCHLERRHQLHQTTRDEFGIAFPCGSGDDHHRSGEDHDHTAEFDMLGCGLAALAGAPFVTLPSLIVSSAIMIGRPSRHRVIEDVEREEYQCDLPAANVGMVLTPARGEPVTLTTDARGTATFTLASADAARTAVVTAVDPDAASVAANAHGRLIGAWGTGTTTESVTELPTPSPFVHARLLPDGRYWMVVYWPAIDVQLQHVGTFDATSTTLVLRPSATRMYVRAHATDDDSLRRVTWEPVDDAPVSFAWTRTQASPEAPTILTLRRLAGRRWRPPGHHDQPPEPAEVQLVSEPQLEWKTFALDFYP